MFWKKCLIKFRILELSQYLTHDGNFWRLNSRTYYEYWLETRQDWIDELQEKRKCLSRKEIKEDMNVLNTKNKDPFMIFQA